MPSALPEKLLEDARASSAKLRVVRESARESAVAAVRKMEAALADALDGETLKGLRELAPGFDAARVRKARSGSFEDLPEPKPFEVRGREVLVVMPFGDLAMARATRVGVETRKADDSDLLVEDVESVARLFAELLGEHVARSERSAERFGRLDALAKTLSAALFG